MGLLAYLVVLLNVLVDFVAHVCVMMAGDQVTAAQIVVVKALHNSVM